MTIELINIGTSPNSKDGDPLRTAFEKVNRNFQALENTSLPGGPDGAVQYRGIANLNAMATLDGLTVATGFPNRVYTSTNLTTWNQSVEPPQVTLTAITTDGSQFIAVGANGTIATSLTGDYWTLQTTGITTDLTGIAYGSSVYVAVGYNGQILRSVDAILWTVETSPTASHLRSVVYSSYHSAFIATGDAGAIITSADGIVWNTALSGITQNLNAVTAYLGTILIAGDAGRILASLDLFNWDIRTSGTLQNLNGITTAVIGTTPTAFAVGANGTVVTSTDAGFITWGDTAYPSPTTQTLIAASTINTGTVAIIGNGGAIFTTAGGSWTDTGIPAGLDGSADLVFDAQAQVLSVAADIVPQTTDTWALGTDTKRWDTGFFSADGGVTIGEVVASEFGGNLELVSASNSSVRAGLIAESVTSNTSTSNTTTTGNITVLNTATITNLEVTGNTLLANVTVGNLEVGNLITETVVANLVTANTVEATDGNFTNSVTATTFYGDGSHLTGIDVTAQGVVNSVQFADANLDFAGAANFTFDASTGTLRSPAVITEIVTATEVVADGVTATTFYGDGANLTGLPVQGLLAGNNISLSDNSGIWTITSIGDGNTQSHGPLNSIQFAGPTGTFDSVPGFTYDTLNANLDLVSSNINAKRVFANITGDLIGNITGNLIGHSVNANIITATSVVANVFGNLTGNIEATNGNIDTLTTSNLTVTGTLTVDDFTTTTANIANIQFANDLITSTGNIQIRPTGDLNLGTEDSFVNGQSAANVNILGGLADGLSSGGTINIISGGGGTSGDAGNVNVIGSNGGNKGNAGSVNIRGGYGDLAGGGDITIIAGDTRGDPSTTNGARVFIQGGNTIDEDGGEVFIQGGNAIGTTLYGGNIHINGGTGTVGPGNIFIANLRWPLADGATGAVLGTDGTGNLDWVTGIEAASLANGTSNITIPVADGNIQMSVGGVANVATVTTAGITTNSVTVAGNANAQTVRANTYIGVDATFSGNVVLGNVTLLGPINVASIDNGNTHVRATANSNVTFEVAGVSNVVVITDNSLVTAGNLLPSVSDTYNLGSPTERWLDLYLYGNTIYIGDAEISSWQEIVLLKGLSVTMDGQIDPGNVPAAGDAFIAGSLEAANAVLANVMISGDAQFDILGGNTANFGNVIANNLVVTGNIGVNQLANGTSNVTVVQDGNIAFGVGGTADVMTVTDATVMGNSFTSNNFILGDATTTACRTYWHKAITADTTPNQVLLEIPAAGQNSVDFKVISVDIPAQNKQSSMITTVTYGNNTSYSEYARSVINTVISDLSVDQTSGNIRLLASPRVPYLIRYTVIVSIY